MSFDLAHLDRIPDEHLRTQPGPPSPSRLRNTSGVSLAFPPEPPSDKESEANRTLQLAITFVGPPPHTRSSYYSTLVLRTLVRSRRWRSFIRFWLKSFTLSNDLYKNEISAALSRRPYYLMQLQHNKPLQQLQILLRHRQCQITVRMGQPALRCCSLLHWVSASYSRTCGMPS